MHGRRARAQTGSLHERLAPRQGCRRYGCPRRGSPLRADERRHRPALELRPAQRGHDGHEPPLTPDLTRGERLFILWGGLKGAVPILLASFALLGEVDQAQRIYLIVFVVVALSVTLQAATIPSVARRLGVPMLELRERDWD